MPHYNLRENNPNWHGGIIADYRHRALINLPNNPRANHNGYVFEHLVIAEKLLGKSLKKTEEVHHVNSQPGDNKNTNLVICQDHIYHLFLHRRTRALKACGHVDWEKCRECKKYDDSSIMTVHTREKHRTIYIHKLCNAKRRRDYLSAKRGGDSCASS